MPSTKLEAKIVATDQFSSTFKKAETTIKGFGNRLKKPFGELGASIFNLRNAVAAFGTAIGARFAARIVTSIADSADQIGKLSERVGVSTEQLSILRFAAEQTGSDFNTLATAIRTATQRIGEFAGTGKGQAAQALQSLGIAEAVKDGEQLEELLPRIADAFQRIDNQAERVNLASKLFGETGGPAFLNLLQQGSAGLRAFAAEARALGLVISKEQAKDAAEFNDELNRLKKTFVGFANEAILPFLQPLKDMSAALRDFLNQSNKVAKVADALARITSPDLQNVLGDARERSLRGARDRFREELDVARRSPRAGESLEDFFNRRKGTGSGPAGSDSADDLTALRGRFAGLSDESAKFNENLERISTTSPFERMIERAGKAREEFSQFHLVILSVGDALVNNISDNLSDIIEGTKSAKQAFSDMAKGILNDLQRIIIRATIARIVGIALGPATGGIASFQHGGFVPAGVTQKAVLHGPEVVVPLGRKFQPQIGAGAGGGNTTIINISAIDVEDFDRKMLGSMRRNDSAVTGLVANSARSSAGLRGAFR
jgi:hypothetical protein